MLKLRLKMISISFLVNAVKVAILTFSEFLFSPWKKIMSAKILLEKKAVCHSVCNWRKLNCLRWIISDGSMKVGNIHIKKTLPWLVFPLVF